MAVDKKPLNPLGNWGKNPTQIKLKANLLAIAPRAKRVPHASSMQAIRELWELQNSLREVGKWDRLVDKKPPNPMGD